MNATTVDISRREKKKKKKRKNNNNSMQHRRGIKKYRVLHLFSLGILLCGVLVMSSIIRLSYGINTNHDAAGHQNAVMIERYPHNYHNNNNNNDNDHHHNDHENDNKPSLILHVGPLKTGTTFLQTKILQHKLVKRALRDEDNIEVVASFGYVKFKKLISECLSEDVVVMVPPPGEKEEEEEEEVAHHRCQNEQIWHEYQGILDQYYQNSNNTAAVLHSVEMYTKLPDNRMTIKLFRSLQEKWNVKVIIFHRQPEEWFRSYYHQTRKRSMYKSKVGAYLGLPEGGGGGAEEEVFTFSKFVDGYMHNNNNNKEQRTQKKNNRSGIIDSLGSVQLFTKIFGAQNVYVFDYHSKDGIAEEFLCNHGRRHDSNSSRSSNTNDSSSRSRSSSFALHAPHACNVVRTLLNKKYLSSRPNSNEFLLFEEDSVIVEAHRRNLFHINIDNNNSNTRDKHIFSRRKMTMELKKYLDKIRTTSGGENQHPQKWNNNNNDENDDNNTIPQRCLSIEKIDWIRNRTLYVDGSGNFFSSSSSPHRGTILKNEETTTTILSKQQQRKRNYKYEYEPMYCELDPVALLYLPFPNVFHSKKNNKTTTNNGDDSELPSYTNWEDLLSSCEFFARSVQRCKQMRQKNQRRI